MNRKKGSITVFLALMLGLMTLFICACLESSRMAAARAQILCGADIGLYSLFGMYDRELLREFELFALDTGEASGGPDMGAVYDVFREYMEPVLKQNSPELLFLSGGFTGYRLLTDEDGEIFVSQVVKSLREMPGEKRMQLSEDGEALLADIRTYRAAGEALITAGGYISSSDGMLPEAGGEIRQLLQLREALEPVSISGLLPGTALSVASGSAAPESLLSRRSIHQGLAFPDGFSPEAPGESKSLLVCYERDKLGCFTDPAESGLRLQLEYVIRGNASDRENLQEILEALFLYRLGVNMEAVRRSAAVSGRVDEMLRRELPEEESLTGEPLPDTEAVRETLFYSIAYLGAAADVRTLFSGGEIPRRKEEADLLTDHSGASGDLLQAGTSSGEGISYEELLEAMLTDTDRHTLIWRGMDMIEQSMRSGTHTGFCMDGCVTEVEVFASVRANSRKTFTLTKAYGYG